MSDIYKVSLGEFFAHSIAGEWGSEPTGNNDVTVFRAADFTKDCKLRLDGGVPRGISPSKLKVRQLEKNHILIEKSGGSPDQPVGRAVLYEPQDEEQIAACSNFIQRMIVKECYEPSFVYYLLLSLYQQNATLPYQQQTTGIINLKLDEYLELQVTTYLDRSTQRKISSILRCVDQQITLTQSQIEKVTLVKQGMMADLFSRGIDTATGQLRPSVQDAPELYYETPLGFLPKGWEALTMQSVADDSRGSTVIGPFGSDLVASDYRPEGVPVVFVRDVKESSFRWVSDTFISNEKAQRLSAHSVTKGDVVVTKMGLPPCIAATYPDDMPCGVITADIIRIRPNADKVLSEWLSLVINSNEVKKQVEKITAGVTRPKVTLKDFRQLQGRFPTRTEQHEILKRLNPINSSIKLGELSLAKLQRQKAGLMRDLLTGKVPVRA
ncbi:restriction endonuclease subunit S [Aeromonas hydrophila]